MHLSFYRPVLVIAVCASVSSSLAQYGSIQWQRCLGGGGADEGAWVEELPDGSYLLAGNTNSPTGDFPATHGGKDIWVAGLSATGAVQWQQVFGGAADEAATSVHKAADGSIVVSGWTLSNNGDISGAHGDRDAWIAKLSSSGELIWQRAMGGSGRDQANALVETPEGDFVLCGMTTISDGDVSDSHGMWDAWVVKVSGGGQLLWQHALGGSENDWATALAIGEQGAIHVTGTGFSTDGDVQATTAGGDAWVFTLEASGALLWNLTIGTSYYQEGGGICLADGGDLFISGHTNSDFEEPCNFIGNARYMAARITPEGAVVWKRWLPGYHYDRATSILPVQEDLMIFGTGFSYLGTFDLEHQGYDPMAYRITTDGDSLWSHIWGGTSLYDYGNRMVPTADGGLLFIGTVWSDNGDVEGWLGSGDAWVVKLGEPGTGVREATDQQAWISPNPNEGLLTVYFAERPIGGRAAIVDAAGRQVIGSTGLVAGRNSLDARSLAAGTYAMVYSDAAGPHILRWIQVER